jgi:hypothetical protein
VNLPSDNQSAAKTQTSVSFKEMPTPKDFLSTIRQCVKETMQTYKETGFSVGIIQNADGTYTAHVYRGTGSATPPYGEMIPRPPPQQHALMHFHTHVPDDALRGLSIMDVLFEAFQNKVYDYFVVANTALNEVNVYQSSKVLKDPDYNHVIQTEKKLATESALAIFKQNNGREPDRAYMDLLNQNKISAALEWLKKHKYIQASRLLEQYIREWNSFMNKTRTRVFPIKES